MCILVTTQMRRLRIMAWVVPIPSPTKSAMPTWFRAVSCNNNNDDDDDDDDDVSDE
jgi:hypothetical protein